MACDQRKINLSFKNVTFAKHRNTVVKFYSGYYEVFVLSQSMINEDDYDYDLAVDDSTAKLLPHFVMWSKKHAILKSLVSTSGEYMEEDVPFDGAGNNELYLNNSKLKSNLKFLFDTFD